MGLEQSIGHYHAVAVKLGVTGGLARARDQGQLVFIDVLGQWTNTYSTGE